MTRVLHVVCDLSGGGAERVVLSLCRHQNADVATVQPGGSLRTRFEQAGIKIHPAGRTPGTLGARALARLVRTGRRFDVVHTHLWAGHTWGGTASWLARVPVRVATIHNVDRESSWKRGVRRVHSKFAHRTVAVSQAVLRWVDADQVIHNGIDLEPYRAAWTGGDGLLAAGRLVRQKGFDVLLQAERSVSLTIAGHGPDRASLERLDRSVQWVGEVDDLPARLSRADAVVIPSRWEGFGLFALEAMAAGAPIIATRVDGLAELVGDAAVLVPPGDQAALSQAIRALLADPERQNALSRAGRLRAQQFTAKRMARAYDRLYDDIRRP